MVTKDFAQFVAEQQQSEKESTVDWNAVRDEWLRDLDSLYQRIADYLQEYVEKGSITHKFSNIILTEEDIGSYSVRKMEIKIGKQYVFLEPIGTMLIGCKGRVDVIGSADRARLMLINSKAKTAADLVRVTVTIASKGKAPPAPRPSDDQPISWAWKIFTHAAQNRFVDLDAQSFFSLLMEVANA